MVMSRCAKKKRPSVGTVLYKQSIICDLSAFKGFGAADDFNQFIGDG